jgi:hypothetical protein
LSPEDVDSYLTGKGMGRAKAAELNGYAGPAHVLEMASQLNLAPDQRARTEALHSSMTSRAAFLGQVAILTPEQNARYAELRGYGAPGAHPGGHSQHGH